MLNVGARVFAGVWVEGAVGVDELEIREEKSESRACGGEGCVCLARGRVVVEAGMNAVIMVGNEDDACGGCDVEVSVMILLRCEIEAARVVSREWRWEGAGCCG